MITINTARGRSIRIDDSEKYTWKVDSDGDLQIFEKETNATVGIFVKGDWSSVLDFPTDYKLIWFNTH